MIKLIGKPLLILVALCAVGFPIGALICWSRVRGPRAARAAQRGALLAGSQLAAVLLVAVALNDYGNFYGSWTSLFDGQPQGVHVSAVNQATDPQAAQRSDRSPASAGQIRHMADPTNDPNSAPPAQWAARGRLESIELTGASSALREHAYVYLPPQYFQPRYAGSRFPAIEMLSDYPGAESQLLDGPDGMRYPAVLLNLIDAKRANPTVLVMLRPSVTYPRDTECTNVPSGPQAESFYGVDLPSQIAHDYRVRPTGWGAIGASMGGYCAAKLAMLHSRVFYAAASIQGYFTAVRDNTTGDLWGGSDVLRNLNDLDWRLQHLPAPPVSILAVSSYDEQAANGYRDGDRFASLATKPMAVQKIIYPHGPHTIAGWRIGLSSELAWLIGALPPLVAVS